MAEAKEKKISKLAQPVEFTKQERFILIRVLNELDVKGLDEIKKRIDMKIALIADWDWDEMKNRGLHFKEINDDATVTLSPKVALGLIEFLKNPVLGMARTLEMQEQIYQALNKLQKIFDDEEEK